MQRINVLLAEDARYSNGLIKDELTRRNGVHLLPIAADGEQALERLAEYRVDLLLLDLILPKYDGIAVLNKMKQLGLEKKPVIILCTALSSDIIIRQAVNLGAIHCLLKPADPGFIVDRALSLYETATRKTDVQDGANISEQMLVQAVFEVLGELSMPPHLLGYHYIRTCVFVVVRQRGFLRSVTTKLYPQVALEFNTTPKRVERVIRHAIEKTWDRCEKDRLREYFGDAAADKDQRPSNSEFIARVSDIVAMRCKWQAGGTE